MDAEINKLAKVVENTATALFQVVQLGLKVVERGDRHLLNSQRLLDFHGSQMRKAVLHGSDASAQTRQFPLPLLDTLFFGPGFGGLLLNRILLFLLQPSPLFQLGQLLLRRLLFFSGISQSGRSGRVTLERLQVFLDGTDLFFRALDQPWPVMLLIGGICQLSPLLFQAMELTFNMPALLCKVSLPGRLGRVFGVEPVKAFIIGHEQPGKRFDGRLAVGVQILARAGHHQPWVHGP